MAILLVLLAAVAGCGSSPPTSRLDEPDAASAQNATATATPRRTSRPRGERRSNSTPAGTRRDQSAVAALAALPVKGRSPKTGYSREQFGDGWLSVDGCGTRDRMLGRDLTDKSYLDDRRVQAGKLNDRYSAARITFARGGASEVDIDHVVALGDAWQKGAQQWSYARRVRFANDALNLLSVGASANRAKGDGDAATWLPPNKRFRCDYVARQVAVKSKLPRVGHRGRARRDRARARALSRPAAAQ
jgi:hypothetical protein